MLTSLGLHKYEKNFKKGLLTDATLPLLNDRSVEKPPLWLSCSALLLSLSVFLSCIAEGESVSHSFSCSALQEVKIPPGPRLLILDHIKR